MVIPAEGDAVIAHGEFHVRRSIQIFIFGKSPYRKRRITDVQSLFADRITIRIKGQCRRPVLICKS